ncbi:hypothetical protein FGM00_14245 [Aggregatimonas sangjinii]|uniref:Uncharacterized protein n=1 Tax=Aggregatimonas sangjinii TaxID=2583587 RepID=A0A5B7SRA3_9FLAO|nr:hypothetical protein [Aggregatimonas sangjinii]QCX01215.1 hypothetical protein FGM00_14245 [Aggregatimonas sangjinii]
MKKLESGENTGFESFFWFVLLILAFLILNACDKENIRPWENEVARLKIAVEPFKNFDNAKSKGYDIKATEYRTQMGFHYLNAGLLDDTFDLENPEVLIFIETSSGGMELVAVEYGISIEDLDNPPLPPEGYSGSDDVWKIDTEFSLWTLHVWVPMENPEGIFTPRNPMLP